jgi:hypothetical protein
MIEKLWVKKTHSRRCHRLFEQLRRLWAKTKVSAQQSENTSAQPLAPARIAAAGAHRVIFRKYFINKILLSTSLV